MEPWIKLLVGVFLGFLVLVASIAITLTVEVCNRQTWSACSTTCGVGVSTKEDRWYCNGEKIKSCWIQNCSSEVEDFCSANPCNENATCTNNEDSFTCNCNTGFTGDGIQSCTPEKVEVKCVENSCHDNATCTVVDDVINCTCLSGFTGNPYVNCTAIAEPLLIGAFNVQVFGQSKIGKPEVVEVLVDIIQRYDIIMIQEIRDKAQTAFPELVRQVNVASNDQYDFLVSGRTGRTSSQEQYGYIWRNDKVRVTGEYQYPDNADIFEREPYTVEFQRLKSGTPNKFSYISIHAKPDDAEAEINHLDNVYEIVAQQFGEDALIGGDYNADCSYVCSSCWADIDMWNDNTYTWLILHDVDTTLSNTDCAYDRLVVAGSAMTSSSSHGVVFRYDLAYNLSEELAKDVSDHYPVEFTLS